MHKTFQLPGYNVRCDFIGVASGGFSEKLNPGVAVQNMQRLVASHTSKHATRIAPGVNYDAHIASPLENVIKAGSLITDIEGHTLTLRPADCIPLIVFSRKQPVLALIHCGRRELDADIVRKTIRMLCDKWQLQAHELEAYLGPGIKKESYMLPVSVMGNLRHANWDKHIAMSGDRISIDLFGFAIAELINAGVERADISSSSIDTATNPDYYSHYATTNHGKQPGLNGFAVTMLPR